MTVLRPHTAQTLLQYIVAKQEGCASTATLPHKIIIATTTSQQAAQALLMKQVPAAAAAAAAAAAMQVYSSAQLRDHCD